METIDTGMFEVTFWDKGAEVDIGAWVYQGVGEKEAVLEYLKSLVLSIEDFIDSQEMIEDDRGV